MTAHPDTCPCGNPRGVTGTRYCDRCLTAMGCPAEGIETPTPDQVRRDQQITAAEARQKGNR